MLNCLKDFKFFQQFKNFNQADQDDLIKSFKVRTLKPDERVYEQKEFLDSFNIILSGKVDIYFPDPKLKQIQHEHTRCLLLKEGEAQRRRDKKSKCNRKKTIRPMEDLKSDDPEKANMEA